MEAKLAAYRAKKARQKQSDQSLFNKLKSLLLRNKEITPKAEVSHNSKEERSETKDPSPTLKEIPATPKASDLLEQHAIAEPTKSEVIMKWVLQTCQVALWVCLWGLFIEIQFGAVFFTISLIIFIYFNTRTGPKDERPSAYSVFNKDCERIQGTLTAEQLQKNMLGVPGVTS